MLNQDQYPTYRAASAAFTPGATPEDIFSITGNANTNVYVQKMGISSIQSTAGINALFVKKRSTANTGGVAVAETSVPLQSGNAAAQAVVQHYTTTPTGVGTIIGSVWNGWVNSPAVATAGVGGLEGLELDFETMYGQPIALLTAAEVLAWSFNAAALPSGLSVLAWVHWFEIPKSP